MQNNKVVHCMAANRTYWIRWDKSEPYMRFDRVDKYITVTVIDCSSRNDMHFEKPFSQQQNIFLCAMS